MHRKLALLCPIALPLLLASAARADCNDPFGKPEQVLDFHFRLSTADWRALLASRIGMSDTNPAACMDQFPEFKGEFRCGTEGPFLKIGLRKKKGEERGSEAFEKPPMKMDINEDFMGMVPEARGQRWPASFGELGFRKLTLNNGQSNKRVGVIQVLPVLQSEHVALRLLGKDVPESPRTAYAKVTMHLDGSEPGTYLGVYVLIEDIDRTALRRRGFAGVGRLEKQSGSQCTPEAEFDDGPPNAAKAAFDEFNGKDPARFPGTWIAEAAKGLDVDALLRQEAIREIVLNGQDTIFNSVNVNGGLGNNWYLYDFKAGLRQYMPWDVDLAFGQQQGNCDPAGAFMPPTDSRPLQCSSKMPILSWCAGGRPYAPTLSRLGQRLACNPEAQKRYLQIMCQLINGPLAADEITKVWDQSFETLRSIVPLEQARVWKGVDPLGDPPATSGLPEPVYETFGSEHRRLRAWIPQRVNFIRDEIRRLGVQCDAGCANGATDSCTYLGCASQRRCENGKWTACVMNTSCHAALPTADGGAPPPSPTTDGGTPPVGGSGPPPPSGTGGAGGAPAPTAGAPGGTAGAGGAAGSAPSGGTGGRGGSAGAPQSMTPPAGGGQDPAGGCACEVGAARGAGSMMPLGAFVLVLAAASLRRRRRR